ncbi:MAG: hypothetical protein ABIU10_05400 [Sphingomicrobium sp.]
MSKTNDRGPLDWLVEMAGASAPAAAAGFAASRLAPLNDWLVGAAVLTGFGTVFAVAFGAMRIIPAEARYLALPDFEQPALSDEILLLDDTLVDGELLLDMPLMDPGELLLDQELVEPELLAAVAELLLDDPLPAAAPESRVVQLFAGGRMPTAGQLQRRIDRHLAGGEQAPVVTKDASDALSEALAELRRSLRQA